MQVGPEKSSRIRAQLVGAAALTGITIAVGLQRKQSQEPRVQVLDRDISRTMRITPDGERINGSWVAVKFEDQELVDLAQSIHGILREKRHLPRIARHLLSQRCHELVVALESRRGEYVDLEPRHRHSLGGELSSLRVSLLASAPDDEPRSIPLKDGEREALARLIESAIFPLCAWDKRTLRELYVTSDRSLGKPRF